MARKKHNISYEKTIEQTRLLLQEMTSRWQREVAMENNSQSNYDMRFRKWQENRKNKKQPKVQ